MGQFNPPVVVLEWGPTGFRLTALRFCCAAVYPNLTDSMIGGELGGWGGVSSKRGLGGTSSGRPAPTPRRPVHRYPARAGSRGSGAPLPCPDLGAGPEPREGGPGWPARAAAGPQRLGCRPGERPGTPAAGGQLEWTLRTAGAPAASSCSDVRDSGLWAALTVSRAAR